MIGSITLTRGSESRRPKTYRSDGFGSESATLLLQGAGEGAKEEGAAGRGRPCGSGGSEREPAGAWRVGASRSGAPWNPHCWAGCPDAQGKSYAPFRFRDHAVDHLQRPKTGDTGDGKRSFFVYNIQRQNVCKFVIVGIWLVFSSKL